MGLWRGLALVVLALALTPLGLIMYQLKLTLQQWDMSIRDTAPAVRSVGPTRVQLERLQYLVSTRVRVADALVAESRWLEGSWIVQGDALIGVDMSQAEIASKDERTRTAVIRLPSPSVLSARVDHEASREWDIRSRSWIPLAGSVLGDRRAMEQQAMRQAQRLVERAAGSEENLAAARRGVAGMLAAFYQAVGWTVTVRWK
jgi:hypothetical protein